MTMTQISKNARHAIRLCAWVLVAATAIANESDNPWSSTATDPVLSLTSSNYESTVFHSGKNGMVMFYQSWCGHCIRFKPTWDQLAKEAHPSIFIARVDCGASAENEICRSSQITSYPTIRYYLDSTEEEYSDSLSLDALREFVGSTLVAPCNPISDVAVCSEKARKYAEKWLVKDTTKISGEIERLGTMMEKSESSATAELRRWMRERRDILKIIHANKLEIKSDGSSDEL